MSPLLVGLINSSCAHWVQELFSQQNRCPQNTASPITVSGLQRSVRWVSGNCLPSLVLSTAASVLSRDQVILQKEEEMELGVLRGMLFRDKVKECGVWFRAGNAEVLGPLWALFYRQRGSEFLTGCEKWRFGGYGWPWKEPGSWETVTCSRVLKDA